MDIHMIPKTLLSFACSIYFISGGKIKLRRIFFFSSSIIRLGGRLVSRGFAHLSSAQS